MDNQNKTTSFSRRQFIGTLGSGVVFMVTAWKVAPSILLHEGRASIDKDSEFEGQKVNVWVQINEDDKITIYNASSEMGQGSMTALAVIIAEELDADWSKVIVKHSSADANIYGIGWGGRGRGSMMTVGSRTVMSYYNSLRQAGAQARYVLMANVAKKWDVPISALKTEPNLVVHKNSGKKISYGDIATFVESNMEIPEIPQDQLKDPKNFRLIGKFAERFDIPSKSNGSAKFAIDINIPNMAYSVVSRSPVNGSKPTLLNEGAILAIKGILNIVKLDHGIAIVAETLELALSTKPKLQIRWSKGETAETFNSEEAFNTYVESLKGPSVKGNVITQKGDISNAFQSGIKQYTSDYKNDFVYHAQMEPLNAVITVSEDEQSAEAWVGTQAPSGGRSAIANVLGINISKVTLHRTYLGGGFGRRAASGWITEAAQVAKESKRPIKLVWTREDDMQYGMFRPQSLQRMQASVDNTGKLIGWKHVMLGTGGRLMASGANIQFYNIPNQHIEVRNINHGVRTKHWRAVGHGPNKFAIEAFIDEIANDQKVDPLEFRLNLMEGFPRAQVVLKTAAKMAQWGTPAPPGRAKGIAFAERSSSIGACVCELSVNQANGEIKVHRIWAALDAGIVVQPDNAIAQMEGALLMGMSSVLMERITFRDGKVEQSNYHDYPILRIQDTPDSIEVNIIPSQERPTGIGESGIPLIGGAIANAFANLTGKRLKHMPFTPNKVKKVLQG